MHLASQPLAGRFATRLREAGARQWLVWAATAIAGGVGLVYGYDFGERLGGPWLGVVLAINGAALCSMVTDAMLDRAAAPRARRRG